MLAGLFFWGFNNLRHWLAATVRSPPDPPKPFQNLQRTLFEPKLSCPLKIQQRALSGVPKPRTRRAYDVRWPQCLNPPRRGGIRLTTCVVRIAQTTHETRLRRALSTMPKSPQARRHMAYDVRCQDCLNPPQARRHMAYDVRCQNKQLAGKRTEHSIGRKKTPRWNKLQRGVEQRGVKYVPQADYIRPWTTASAPSRRRTTPPKT